MIPTLAMVILGILVVQAMHRNIDERNDDTNALTIRATMNVAWSAVVLSLLNEEDRVSVAIVPSVAWMALMWWIDSYALVHQTKPRKRVGVKLDSHTVTAMSFGICGLVGARSESRYVHFILYALLLCIMFVLPVHNLPTDDPMTSTVEEIQRMCLMYAISLLVTGVVFTRMHPTRVRVM